MSWILAGVFLVVLGGGAARYSAVRRDKIVRQLRKAEHERERAFMDLYDDAEGILALRETDQLIPYGEVLSPRDGPPEPPFLGRQVLRASNAEATNAWDTSGQAMTDSYGTTGMTYDGGRNLSPRTLAAAALMPPGVAYLAQMDDYLLPSGRRVGRPSVEAMGWDRILDFFPDDRVEIARRLISR